MPSAGAAIGLFVISLGALLVASDRLTAATARIGLAAGISPFIIGATVVAGGTSLPELVSSTVAVLEGTPEIVLGNVVGSNIANILVIIGLAAVVGRRIQVERELMRVDLPILVFSALFLLIAVWNSGFVWAEGILALGALVVYVHFTLARPTRLDDTVEDLVETHIDEEIEDDFEAVADTAEVGTWTIAVLVASLAVVALAAAGLVRAIIDLAAIAGVGPGVVAVTAVGLGTSLPEIAVSIMAVRRDNPEVAIGNVLGSNVFNTFAVMGVPSLIAPLPVPSDIRAFALPVMVLSTVLYYFVTQDREITRWEGAVLLLLYAVFMLNLLAPV